ncbi:ndufs1 NADH-ubiquinone oxidoreductase subunit [Hypoxylon texense]
MVNRIVRFSGDQLTSFKTILGGAVQNDRLKLKLLDVPLLKDAYIYVNDGPTNVQACEQNQKWITLKQLHLLQNFIVDPLKEYISMGDPLAEALRKDYIALSNLFNPSPQFHRFQDLPPEIRAMVWDYATLPRFVRVSNNRLTEYGKPRSIPPVTVRVCRESRAIACRHGRLVPIKDPYSLPSHPIPAELELSQLEAEVQAAGVSESDSGDETSQADFDEEPLPSNSEANLSRSMSNWGWFDPSRDSLMVSDYPFNVPKVIAQSVQHITLDYTSMGIRSSRLAIFCNTDTFPQLKAVDYIAYRFQLPEFRDPIIEARLFGFSLATPVTVPVDDVYALIERLEVDHSSHDLDRIRRLELDIAHPRASEVRAWTSERMAIERAVPSRRDREGKLISPSFRRVVRFDLSNQTSENWQ